MPGAYVPEVDQNNAEAIEGVEDDRSHEANFCNAHEWSLVGANDCVVGLRAHAHQRGVENVHEQKEVDTNSSDAVENPRPHSFAAAIQRSAGDHALFARGGNLNRHRR